MPNTRVVQVFSLVFISIVQLAGCSIVNRVFPDKSNDYLAAQDVKKLEVPPDLNSKKLTDDLVVPSRKASEATVEGVPASNADIPPETVTDSGVNSASDQETPATPTSSDHRRVIFKKDGQHYWLMIKDAPANVWGQARQFWLEKDFELTLDDATVGVLETDWINSRAITPGTGKRSLLGRVFSNEAASVYRDRYRMRVEQGQTAGTTEIYIKHQGIEEVLEGTDEEIPVSRWIPRPSESGLESEMLKRLMLSLGASVYDAQHPEMATKKNQKVAEGMQPEIIGVQSELKKSGFGKTTIELGQGFQLAWGTVGKAIKSAGIPIDDLNRSKGVYYVQPEDIPESKKRSGGFFSGLLGGNVHGVDTEESYDDGRLLVKIKETNERESIINVTDATGVVDNTKLANQLLKLIQKNIR
ncbi:MAG: outer membrane protein assembly factor BamC [Gammaproteobacteria bacterium]